MRGRCWHPHDNDDDRRKPRNDDHDDHDEDTTNRGPDDNNITDNGFQVTLAMIEFPKYCPRPHIAHGDFPGR